MVEGEGLVKNKMGKVELIGVDEFADAVENASGVVVVDFMATWCPPCKMLAPVLERVAHEMDGKARIFKVDTDVHEELGLRYGVRKVPNVTIFKDGEVVDQSVGFMTEPQLIGKIKPHLAE